MAFTKAGWDARVRPKVAPGCPCCVALLAAVGGAYGNIVEACDATISRVSELQPNAETAKRYDAAFPIYRDLYVALKAQFGAIAGL